MKLITRTRYIFVLALFLFSFTCIFAQLNKCNGSFIQLTADPSNFPKEYMVLVKGDVQKMIAVQKDFGVKINYYCSTLASVTGPLANLLYLANTSMVQRLEFSPNLYLRPLNDTMRVKNNINLVHSGQAPLSQGYTGKGVLMGMIDSGLDFNHPDFKDSTGRSRILYIWDQTFPVAANTPAPFGYGQEWDSSYFNNGTCPHNDLTWWGHGTHTTGISAGNGGQSGAFKGVAPDAHIIMVALDFYSSNATIADAVNYIFKKADSLGMPCVINASVGDYYGSHDGKDLQSQFIDSMLLTPGRILVGASGNAGTIKYHLGYTVTADTNFTWLSNGQAQLSFQVYADTPDFTNVQYSIGANENTNFSDRGSIGFKNASYALGTLKLDTIYNNGNRIGVVQTVGDTVNGVYSLNVVVFVDSVNYLWRFDATGSGEFHLWNFDLKSSGLPTSGVYPRMTYYKMPDTLMTVVSGFQCSDNVITVGNYTNMDDWYDVNGNLQTWQNAADQIAPSSSQGPTRDGRIKPDIAASGDQIFAAGVISLLPGSISSNPGSVSSDSLHVMGGGTSSSSPVVAGVAAFFLERDPLTTPQLFKEAVINCPKLDGFTGTTGLPNTVWGYGKLDGFAAMTCQPVSTGITKNNFQAIPVYPNPSGDVVNFDLGLNFESGTIELYDYQGRKVETKTVSGKLNQLSLKNYGGGIYFYRVSVGGNVIGSGKLVRE